MLFNKNKNFSDISPLCYEISKQKGIVQRNIQDMMTKETFASQKQTEKLANLVYAHDNVIIKVGKGIDPILQENKGVNIQLACKELNGLIIQPQETFSFWHLIGKTSKKRGYKPGRVIEKNDVKPGYGGGLCNLANTINLTVLHSPLKITEFHTHSDALACDVDHRVPLSAGTSVCYNYIDYRFKNTTDQKIQLLTWVEDGKLKVELRSEKPFPYEYEIVEEGHHFHKENDKMYRISKIYQNTKNAKTHELIDHKLIWDNHSLVQFDYDLIPENQIQ